MNATLIPSIMISLFLFFIILGFVIGWIRGLNKSLTRFIIVLVVGVLSFFVIPPLTSAVLTLDISKLNIVIGDIQVMTIQDLITDMLRQIPIIEDIIEASPTFESFLEVVPQMLLNVILFIVFFFVFKWISMVIYWIISGICFSKKKMNGKEKHPFIGAVIGAVQGLIVVVVVLIPCFGAVEMFKPFETIEQENQQNTVQYVNSQEPEDEKSTNDVVVETINGVIKYTDAFEQNWVGKLFKAVGIKKLSVKMFDKLTTVEGKSAKFALMDEVDTLADAYPYMQTLLSEKLDIEDNETLNDIKSMINELYKSELLSGMVKEIVPEVSRIWSSGGKFCEIQKPKIDDEALDDLFDVLLLNLSVAEGDTVKNDIDTSIDILMIANDAKLISTMSEDGNILEVLRKPENENLISDILTKALESNTIKAVLPEAINVGMNYVYEALNIDKETIDDVDVDSADVDWTEEKPILITIFTNVFKIYDKIDIGTSQGEEALEHLDFKLLGETFDNVRKSTLLGPSSKQIMKALLNSEEIVGANSTTLNTFVTKLEETWDSDELLAPTFESLGKALKIAKDLQTNVEDFKIEDLGDVLTDFATNDALKDVVSEVIKEDTLKDLGLDDNTAGVVSETISSVLELEGEVLEKEIKAVEEIFVVANKVINLDTTENPEAKVEIAEEDTLELVGALAQSTEVLGVITGTDSAVGDLNIGDNLSEETKTNIKDQITNLEAEEDVKNKLKDLFGIAD